MHRMLMVVFSKGSPSSLKVPVIPEKQLSICRAGERMANCTCCTHHDTRADRWQCPGFGLMLHHLKSGNHLNFYKTVLSAAADPVL